MRVACAKPELECGGPQRVLGMLYLRAPAWPQGIGDPETALELLAEAARKYPQHPLNRQFYAEALLTLQQPEQAAVELREARRLAHDWWQSHFHLCGEGPKRAGGSKAG